MREVVEGGTLREIFGIGIVVVISLVGSFYYKGKIYRVVDGKIGFVSQRFYEYILVIQYGCEKDLYGWMEWIDF